MPQYVKPHQNPIGLFRTQQAAEAGLQALIEAGFTADHLTLVPQSLNPNPPLAETEALAGAGAAAIAGAITGSLGGMAIAYMSWSLGGSSSDIVTHLIGLGLLGSGVGALGAAILGALTGVNVKTAERETPDTAAENYLILIDGTPAELEQAQAILKEYGSELRDFSQVRSG